MFAPPFASPPTNSRCTQRHCGAPRVQCMAAQVRVAVLGGVRIKTAGSWRSKLKLQGLELRKPAFVGLSHAVSGHFNGFAVKCRQITTVARLILANAALHSTCCWLFQGHSASLACRACYVAGVNLLFSEATLVTRWSVHVYQVFLLLSPASSVRFSVFSRNISLISYLNTFVFLSLYYSSFQSQPCSVGSTQLALR